MEVLVARIALYPDELVAAIVAASLYPVQLVQAQRYLDQLNSKPDLKPDKDWDGSVISLLNYPEIVKMMRGAVIDWDDWGVWGGNGNWGNDIDINCNNCFNDRNFNGKVNWNDVDWNNIDRSKISIDKNQFNKLSKNDVRRGLEANERNNLKNKTGDLKRKQSSNQQGNRQAKDVRKSTAEGLQKQGNRQAKDVRKSTAEGLQKQSKQEKAKTRDTNRSSQGVGNKASQGDADKAAKRTSSNKTSERRGKSKSAAKKEGRSKKASSMDDINRNHQVEFQSRRQEHERRNGSGRVAQDQATSDWIWW